MVPVRLHQWLARNGGSQTVRVIQACFAPGSFDIASRARNLGPASRVHNGIPSLTAVQGGEAFHNVLRVNAELNGFESQSEPRI